MCVYIYICMCVGGGGGVQSHVTMCYPITTRQINAVIIMLLKCCTLIRCDV